MRHYCLCWATRGGQELGKRAPLSPAREAGQRLPRMKVEKRGCIPTECPEKSSFVLPGFYSTEFGKLSQPQILKQLVSPCQACRRISTFWKVENLES